MASKKALDNASGNDHSEPDSSLSLPTEIRVRNPRALHLSGYREVILEMHLQIIGSVLDGLQRAIVCGSYLNDVKAIVPHGSFTTWIQENFAAGTGLSERTAQRYRRISQAFSKFLKARGHGSVEVSLSNPRLLLEQVQEYHDDCSRESSTGKTDAVTPEDLEPPDDVATAVLMVLEMIECNPCAPHTGSKLGEIQYTKNDDGLSQPWPGTAWVAPSHSAGDIKLWCLKALSELKNGNLTDAILCLPETALRQVPELYRYPIAISFSPMDVNDSAGSKIRHKRLPTCNTFVYLSKTPKTELFAAAFKEIAAVFAPVMPDTR